MSASIKRDKEAAGRLPECELLCFGYESREFKQILIQSGSEVDAFCGFSKSMFKECGKNNSKQCRDKDTALLNATKDVEEIESCIIVQYCSLHVIIKGLHDAE